MRLEPIPVPDWRDDAAYAGLLAADRICFAWEWLRRDPTYRTAAIGAPASSATEQGRDDCSERWGLHEFENPGLDSLQARPMWTAAHCPGVLTADALPAASDSAAFDLGMLSALARLCRGSEGRERLLLADGQHLIRLDIASGSIARGPVTLCFRLEGPLGLNAQIRTLRRLAAVVATGRFSRELHRPELGARRWLMTLRAADALAVGASQRDIAVALLGLDPRQARWRTEAPNIRGRAQRLVQQARSLASGGYREFLE